MNIVEKINLAKGWTWGDFTEKEQSAVVEMLTERLKNSIEMLAMSRSISVMKQLEGKFLRDRDTITVKFDFEFIWGDIIEIIGGLRRDKEESKSEGTTTDQE